MAMASNVNESADILKCPICFEQFTEPKYLPCLHTFCKVCMNTYVMSHVREVDKGNTTSFPCPVCRQDVQIDKNVPLENIADTMPGNHLIVSLMNRPNRQTKHEDEVMCDPCSVGNVMLPANTWCTFCSEALCETCTLCHARMKQTKSHPMVQITEYSKQEIQAKLVDIDEPCPVHKGKTLEVYCVDHKRMCCVICLATQHRRCENISTFEDMVKEDKLTSSVQEFKKQLLEVKGKAEALQIKGEENINTLEIRQVEISEEVSAAVQKAIDAMEKQKTCFLSKLQQVQKEQKVVLKERNGRIESFLNNLKQGLMLMQKVCENGAPKQIFVTKEKLKMQIQNHMGLLNRDLRNTGVLEYILHIEDQLNAVMQSKVSVADLEVKQVFDSLDERDEFFTSLGMLLSDTGGCLDMAFEKLYSIETQGAEYTDGTYLPDGRSVFCDFTNMKLKLYDKDGKLIVETSTKTHPRSIACLSNEEIVATFETTNRVVMYSVKNDSLVESDTIMIPSGSCSRSLGIAVVKNNFVVAKPSSVKIFSREGKCVHSISRTSKHPHYVTASKITGNIYYSEGDIIVCQSLDRKEIFRYKHELLDTPSGIALDANENVYVCGKVSNNIHVISPDGKSGKVILTEIVDPYGIGFSKDGTKVFVTCVHQNHIVYVYQLVHNQI